MLFILELCMTTVERQCKVIPALTKCTQIINSLTRTMFSMLEFMCGDSDVNHKQSVRFVSTPLSLFFKWRFWYTGQTSSPFHHLLTLPFPFLWPHLPQLHCVSFFEALVHCGCASMKCKWWKQTSWSHTVWWSGFCPLMVAALEETYCNVWHGSSRPAEIYTMSLKNEVEESCRSVDMVREPASKLDQKYSALWSSITTLTLFFLLTDSGWRFWWEFVWASSGDISERSCNSSILHRPRHHWPPGGVRLPTALPAVWHG